MFGPLDCEASYATRVRARLGASDVVRWSGAVPPDEAFAEIDVLVLPSQSEAQPIAVLEAMARAIPVVATSVGDVPEMVEHAQRGRRGGIVVPTLDAMVDTVIQLADHPTLRRRLGERGRERVRRFYSIEATAGAYQRAYASIPGPTGREFACAS